MSTSPTLSRDQLLEIMYELGYPTHEADRTTLLEPAFRTAAALVGVVTLNVSLVSKIATEYVKHDPGFMRTDAPVHPWRDDRLSNSSPTVSTVSRRAIDRDVYRASIYRLRIYHVLDAHRHQRFMAALHSELGCRGTGNCHVDWQAAYDEGVAMIAANIAKYENRKAEGDV